MLYIIHSALLDDLPFDEFCSKVRQVPNHLFDDHENCQDSCPRKKDATWGPNGKYLNKKDPANLEMFNRVMKLIGNKLTDRELKKIHHKFATQICEALNLAVALKAPKYKTYSMTTPLRQHVATTQCQHNDGYSAFYDAFFKKVVITLTTSSQRHFEVTQKRRENVKNTS